jgi:UDP-N-acetyl-D-mannosaminuronic acid transferase (WecB/TagA/CpsF family)
LLLFFQKKQFFLPSKQKQEDQPMETVNLLGVDFDNLDVPGVVHIMLNRRASARFTYVVTPNADHFARLRRLPQLRRVYEAAWLRLLDSQMLRHAASSIGLHAPHVATGADITAALLAALPPQKIAIIGLDPKFLPFLASRHPGLDFAHFPVPKDFLHNRPAFIEARNFAVATGAAFTFIATGSPAQELLAYAIALQPGSAGIGLCIGAALEYRAGAKSRAPAWMRGAGLEWLYRLLAEPKRLGRRYLVDDPPVLFDLVAERLKRTSLRSLGDQHPRSAPAAIVAFDPYRPRPTSPLRGIHDAM